MSPVDLAHQNLPSNSLSSPLRCLHREGPKVLKEGELAGIILGP